MPLIAGVDGGGTHTRARVADSDGAILATAESGSSNLSVTGAAGAQAAIAQALAQALDDALALARGRALTHGPTLAALCLGLSGVDRPDERELFRAWAARYAPRVAIVNDGELVLAAGTPEGWGLALISGTGSIGFARDAQGRVARAGGWGYLIGDEGSGGELGREAVRAAARAADGRARPTRLLDDILAYWGLRSADQFVERVYRAPPDATPLRPADFAALAPLVLAAADAGDVTAVQLLEHTVHELAQLALTLAERLDLPRDATPLGVGGGLLSGSERIRTELLHICAASGYAFAPVGLVSEPVAGAVEIARRLVRDSSASAGGL